ncbi:dTDP-4-amino-4,6-dideoxyglucose formyltransferase [Vibrio cholerae]|nr:dTDP-4-amino-4,6-dideoxyglucose formyltransferase [Vibrio cholerae]
MIRKFIFRAQGYRKFRYKKNYKSLIGHVDLIISCHCKKIFPAELVNRVKCINIHPGLNPYNRGWYPQVFAINNGMPHGATIHEMDEEIDHGNIIVQEEIKIEQTDTSKSVYDKVVLAELKMFKQHVSSLISGAYKAKKMVHEGNYNSISDFNELCKIDMNKGGTFREFYNLLRSLQHEPYSNAYFFDDNGDKVYIEIKITKQTG